MRDKKNEELCRLLGWKVIQPAKNFVQLVGPDYEGELTHIDEKHMIVFPRYYTDPALIPEIMEAMRNREMCPTVALEDFKSGYVANVLLPDEYGDYSEDCTILSIGKADTPQAALAEACRAALLEAKHG